jgi:polyhydroxyalkanoate synthesis regulator phasin
MTEDMAGDKKGPREKVSDGIKQGIGVLSAFKEALEETINEARERGDLSAERAKDVMKDALERAHSAAEGAKGRLDLVSQKEFDGLAEVVEGIRERVSAMEARIIGTEGGTPEGDSGTDAASDAPSEGDSAPQ